MNRRDFIASAGVGLATILLGDYNFISIAAAQDQNGVCIYCNNCQPCPAGIDISAVNKCLDLANSSNESAKDYYFNLSKHASDCIGCGVCEQRCPVHVKVRKQMRQAIGLFGK
ncbi:4Fe-4S binding protein [Sporomusa aerivorans]|uniref:4Fe-4S binding protein n=1 Tax=Sporomusa aerivorans TaxID=204936 RepID=UPI00352AF117